MLSILSPFSHVTGSCPRTACAFYIRRQPSDQLKYKSSLRPLLSIFPVKWLVRIQEQLAPVKMAFESPQWVLSFVILLMSISPAMDATYSFRYSVNVNQSRNGYDMLCCLLFCQCLPIPQWIRHILLNSILSCLAFITQMLHGIHSIYKCIFTPKISANVDI